MFFQSRKLAFCFALGIILFIPSFTQAVWSHTADFYIESDYDLFGRDKIESQLIKTTNKIYFYADKDWYNSFSQKSDLDNKIYNLSSNFEYRIYPFLTNLLGFEDNPGIDNDSRIIVVFEPLKQTYGGYVRTGDQYSKSQYSRSNEGQIIYLNANLITQSSLDFLSYELAHEFTHLITLKQKPEAETWFYELISEFAGQSIGVDISQVTKKRAQNLLYSTEVNLKDWQNTDRDYGKIYLFALYLKEQFGNQVFTQALKHSSSYGVICLDETFKKINSSLGFNDVYLNWLIANLVNDCFLGKEYCYQDSNFKKYSVIPYSYYLPRQAKSTLSVTDSIFPLTGKWQKLTGGLGTVKLKFTIPEQTVISKIPYLIEDSQGKKTLGFLDFNTTNIQEVYITEMGSKNTAVYFIPYLDSNLEDNKIYYYSFEAQNLGDSSENEEQIIKDLLQKIAELKRQIAQLQLQLALKNTYQTNPTCSLFTRDLFYGITSTEVKCLQQFLANLGPEIYPEALVTGYYGPLTKAAVKRYQVSQGIIATGYFGPLTRARINQGL